MPPWCQVRKVPCHTVSKLWCLKWATEVRRCVQRTGKVSSYCYICVLILVLEANLYVSSYCYICVLMLLFICPHTAISVLILLHMCRPKKRKAWRKGRNTSLARASGMSSIGLVIASCPGLPEGEAVRAKPKFKRVWPFCALGSGEFCEE